MIYENDIIPIISSLKRSFQSDPYPRLKVRRLWLKELESLLTKNEAKFIDAINSDFGNRSMFETLSCEILPTISAIKHAYKNLPLWMKEEKRRTSPIFWFGKSSVLFQPIGLVAIISPWNYPLQLTLIPLVNALAAGNRVILKPSEKTKHFSALLRDIFTKDFDNSAAKVLTGDRKTSKIIVSNKDIDHIFFTGSTIVGKEIAKTAAINLTPVTLELGGKSPAYISKTANLTSALKSIVKGKIINAGQTCIAPDYLIVNSVHEKKFLEKFFFILEKLYPNILENDDYTSILSENNLLQLIGLLKDANKKGGKVLVGIKNSIEDLDFDKKKSRHF